MFQILDFTIPCKNDPDPVNANKAVIDDQLKSEYRGGITGLTIWTPYYEHMRQIEIELKIDGEEVFPSRFPAELFSANQFRNTTPLELKFPAESKIEGVITNNNEYNDKDMESVNITLIFNVKLKE